VPAWRLSLDVAPVLEPGETEDVVGDVFVAAANAGLFVHTLEGRRILFDVTPAEAARRCKRIPLLPRRTYHVALVRVCLFCACVSFLFSVSFSNPASLFFPLPLPYCAQVGFAEGDGLVEAAWSTARCDARLGFLVLEVTGEPRLRDALCAHYAMRFHHWCCMRALQHISGADLWRGVSYDRWWLHRRAAG
jgi:hypothetical protein